MQKPVATQKKKHRIVFRSYSGVLTSYRDLFLAVTRVCFYQNYLKWCDAKTQMSLRRHSL